MQGCLCQQEWARARVCVCSPGETGSLIKCCVLPNLAQSRFTNPPAVSSAFPGEPVTQKPSFLLIKNTKGIMLLYLLRLEFCRCSTQTNHISKRSVHPTARTISFLRKTIFLCCCCFQFLCSSSFFCCCCWDCVWFVLVQTTINEVWC